MLSQPLNVSAEAEVPRRIVTDRLFDSAVQGAIEWECERIGGDTLAEGFISAGMAGSSEADWFMLAQHALGLEDDYAGYVAAAGQPDTDGGDELLTEPARRNVTLSLLGGSGSDMSGAALEEAGCNELVWVALSQRLNGFDDTAAMTMLAGMQQPDGGFGLRGSDADVTAMALTVLEGSNADRAERWLRDCDSFDSCETAAWCIIAACSRGERAALNDDYADENGVRPIDVLFACRHDSGGFSHQPGGEPEWLSTAQALTALSALSEYSAGGGGLFDGVPADETKRSRENIAGETEQALKQLAKIEQLNTEIRAELYPPEDIKLTKLPLLLDVNDRIETIEPQYRGLVLAQEELAARETVVKKWSAAGVAFGVIWKIAAFIALLRFRKTKLAKGLKEKYRSLGIFKRLSKSEGGE